MSFKYPFLKTSHGTASLLQQVTREAGGDSILSKVDTGGQGNKNFIQFLIPHSTLPYIK